MNLEEIRARAEAVSGPLVILTKSEYGYLLNRLDMAESHLVLVAKLSLGLLKDRFNEAHAEVIRDTVIRLAQKGES